LGKKPGNDKPKIVVVDDDPLILEAVSELLGQFGYASLPFSAAADALENLEGCKADAVLTDINMPVMTGLELLDRVASLCPAIPVILMTAYSETQLIINAQKNSAFDMIMKPFSPESLINIIGKAVRHRAGKTGAQRILT